MRQFRSVNDYIVDNRYPFKRYDTFVAAARDNNVDLHIKTSEREKERERFVPISQIYRKFYLSGATTIESFSPRNRAKSTIN